VLQSSSSSPFLLDCFATNRPSTITITSTSTIRQRRTTFSEVPLDYSAEMGRLTGQVTGLLPARSYAEVPDDGFLHA
jgi:hypothetical protein